MILHSQFSISGLKTRAILLFKMKIKLIEMFELNERMPGMRSTEYQVTIPLKFSIIIHNYGKNLATLCNDSSFTVQHFRFDDKGNFAV